MEALVTMSVSMLAKQAFGTLVSVAVKNLRSAVETQLGDKNPAAAQILELQDLLDVRLQILSAPVDICVQLAAQGNSCLNAGVEQALAILREVDGFSAQMIAGNSTKPDGPQPDTEPSTRHARAADRLVDELKRLIARLDAVLPYLTLALQTVTLVRSAQGPVLSPSCLMNASQLLSAASSARRNVCSVPIRLHRLQRSSAARRRQYSEYNLEEVWALGTASVGPRRGGVTSDAAEGRAEWELRLEQNLNDGRFHDDDSAPDRLIFPLASVLRIEVSSKDAMKVGYDDRVPLLLLRVEHSSQAPDLKSSPQVPEQLASRPSPGLDTLPASTSRSSPALSAGRRPATRAIGSTDKLETPQRASWYALEMAIPDAADDDDDEDSDGNGTDSDCSHSSDGDEDENDDEAAGRDDAKVSKGQRRGGSGGTPALRNVLSASRQSLASFFGRGCMITESPKPPSASPPPQHPCTSSPPSASTAAGPVVDLRLFEYVLRLAALESREQRPHTAIEDEKLLLVFREGSGRRAQGLLAVRLEEPEAELQPQQLGIRFDAAAAAPVGTPF